MKNAEGFSLVAVATVLCVACYQNDSLKEIQNDKQNVNDFTAGSLEDCSSVSPLTNSFLGSEFDGVDMLVVVDNSGSMAEEQQLLSTGFYTLINTLTKPLLSDRTWAYPPFENVRLAVVSSDLALSYGENRETALSPSGVFTCSGGGGLGDNGNFLSAPSNVTTVNVADGQIRCEAGGGQCPPSFSCDNIDPDSGIGVCRAPDGVLEVSCMSSASEYASTMSAIPNKPDLAGQAACMAAQGTVGCGFEQQLEAAVTGLDRHPDFLVDSHQLAVLIVSDEEDCSIADPGLFDTAEWNTPQIQNTACNISSANEAHLFPTGRYREKFSALKGGQGSGVIFAAIVGVPTAAESAANGWPLCEGTGSDITGCLTDNPAMEMRATAFTDPNGNPYTHFAPSCVRNDAVTGVRITEARPGRRYVNVASEFQENSFVYSICNADWRPAMVNIATVIAKQNSRSCYPQQMEWSAVAAQPAECADGNCGESSCDMVVTIARSIDDSDDCPDMFYADLSEAEKTAYRAKQAVVPVKLSNGEVLQKNILCPLPKLPAPLDCASAVPMARSVYAGRVGWYYCEEDGENFYDACFDGLDNDGDGLPDCEDEGCAGCRDCGGKGENCDTGRCRYQVSITPAAGDAIRGDHISVQCMKQGELSADACGTDRDGSLGSACTQPGFSEDDMNLPCSSGVDTISFQKGCDCMTYHSVNGADPGDLAYSHFCTRPCDLTNNDCPAGFVCTQAIGDTFDTPDDMAHAYCVPECVETPCMQSDQHCTPTTAAGDTWTCQSM